MPGAVHAARVAASITDDSLAATWWGGRRTFPAVMVSSQPASSIAAPVRSLASRVSATKSLGPNVR